MSIRDKPWICYFAEILGIALGYFVLARIGQVLAIDPGNVTPFWPASGFALVMVLSRGYRVWPGIWLGNFLGNTWAFFDPSQFSDALRTLATGLAIGPGDVAQALVGAFLIKKLCRKGDPLGGVRDVFVFTGTQAFACLFSATFGVLALCLGGIVPWGAFGYTWLTWYVGDGLGVILIAPLLLSFFPLPSAFRNGKAAVEACLMIAASFLVSALVFTNTMERPLAFLPLPVILWAAIRGGQFETTVSVLVITGVAIWGTYHGGGPFAHDRLNGSLLILQLFSAIVIITGAAVASALKERRRAERELRTLASELVLAEERERKRLAMILHEDLCQNLASARMCLDSADRCEDTAEQAKFVGEARSILDQTVQDARAMTFDFGNPTLNELGLERSLSKLLTEKLERQSGITTEFHDDGQEKPMTEDIRSHLYRSVRELLTNIIKHSQAKHAEVGVSLVGDQILICVQDDGVGFDPDQVVTDGDHGGFGLYSIRERINQMGGTLKIDSSPGNGCRTTLRVSLASA